MSLEQLKAEGWLKEANYIAGEWVGADDGKTYAVETLRQKLELVTSLGWV
jgi:hypothetical protein